MLVDAMSTRWGSSAAPAPGLVRGLRAACLSGAAPRRVSARPAGVASGATSTGETVRHAPPPDRAAAPPDDVSVPRWLRAAGAASWRLLAVGALVVAVLYLLSLLRVVVLPVILATLASTLLRGPTQALRRRGLPPAAAVPP